MHPTCTRIIEFDAGHRLQRHESKCRNVHGHRYKLQVTCRTAMLDAVGRVIEFGDIKRLVGGWIDEQLDHGFIAEEGDPIIPAISQVGSKLHIVDFSPTAENLVRYIGRKAQELLAGRGVSVVHVQLWETPNAFATWEPAQ